MTIQELYTVLGFKVDTSGIESAKSAVTSFKRFVGGLGIGYVLYQGARVALETAAAYQSSEAQFTTLLKSQVKAQDLMKELFTYAKESTFEMEHVTKAQDILMSYGMASDKAFQSMKMLGDVAGADSHAFNRLALATAQVFGKTRLMGEEMRQLLNARGGLIAKQVSDMFFGGDRAKMEAAQRAKKVSFEMFYQALQALTSRGGALFENQKNQMNTLLGRWTSMKDNIKNVGREMVMAMEVPIKGLMELIQNTDFTPFINMAKLVGFSIEYLAQVIWQTGLKDSWEEFKNSMAELGVQFGISSRMGGSFGDTLFVVGTVLRTVIQAALVTIVFIGQIVKAFWDAWNAILKFADACKIAAIAVSVILAAFAGFKVAALIMALETLPTLGGALAASRVALMAWGAASLWNPVMVGIALFGALALAVGRANAALEEKAEIEAFQKKNTDVAEATTSAVAAMNRYKGAVERGQGTDMIGELASKDADRWIGRLEELGAKTTAAGLRARKDRFSKGIFKVSGTGGAPEGVPKTPEELATLLGDPKAMEAYIKAQTAGDTKTQNVTINSEFNVTTPGSPDGKSGLSAQEVADLASRAARSVFSMEVVRLSEGLF